MDLDEKDLILLRELQADSNRTNRDMAKIVGVAGNTLSDRIKRLQDEGAIRRIGAVINPAAVGLTITAFVFGKFKDQSLKKETGLLDDLVKTNRVVKGAQISEVHTLFGIYDVVMKVRAENNSGLQDLLNTIEMDGRLETITSHVATSVLENSGVVIEPGKK